MGEWMKQIPVKLPLETVAQIDAEVRRFPMCAGRSAYVRLALESWFKLLEEGIVTALPEGFEINTGIYAQRVVADILTASGRCVNPQRHNAPFDLLVDGWRVEVKCAKPYKYCREVSWKVKSSKSQNSDFYVVRLEGFYESGEAVHLLLAPLKPKSVRFSRNTVGANHQIAVAEFDKFKAGSYGRRAA